MFRTHTECDWCPGLRTVFWTARERQLDSAFGFHLHGVVGKSSNAACDKVHRRGADETCNKEIGGIVIKIERLPDLFHIAIAQNDNLVGHRHRLHLIVGDVDHGRVEPLVQFGQLDTHLHPQLGVEVGEGFVKEEDLGFAHNRPSDGHTLSLPSGKLLGLALKVVLNLEDVGGFAHPAVDLRLGHLGKPQPKGHVLIDVHVGIKRVGLEDHRNAPLSGW